VWRGAARGARVGDGRRSEALGLGKGYQRSSWLGAANRCARGGGPQLDALGLEEGGGRRRSVWGRAAGGALGWGRRAEALGEDDHNRMRSGWTRPAAGHGRGG
jgi:hypothetical protein